MDVLERSASLADRVAASLREAIEDGEFEFGEALSEAGLSEKLGVSRTPVREAFARLQREGLVVVRPQRGTFVFDLSALDPMGAERAHLEAEATRLAYDARNRFIADPDHTTRLDHMLAPETARQLAALIDPERALAQVSSLTESVHKDTVYLTVVDCNRMAVSLIYSVFHSFGSGLASNRFGLAFQNRGAGFTLTEGHPNEAGGGKRPMHTIIPAMLQENGRITLPFGVMGGAYQPAGHARVVSNLVDFGMELQSALDAPRAFAGPDDEGSGLMLETGYPGPVFDALAEKGHRMLWRKEPLGGAQAIRIEADGTLTGASDPRKDGCALGY